MQKHSIKRFVLYVQTFLMAAVLALALGGGGVHADGSFDITGTVTAADGSPIANVGIYATVAGQGSAVAGSVFTAADGSYDLPIAQAGTYDIYYYYENSTPQVVDRSVTVVSSQVVNQQFSFDIHTISGTVTDQNGNPLSGYSMFLEGPNQTGIDAMTDTNGNYSFPAIATTYTNASISSNQPGVVFNVSSSTQIDATNSDATQDFQLTLEPLTVKTEDAQGNPVSNMTVMAITPFTSVSPIVAGQTSAHASTGFEGITDTSGTTTGLVPLGVSYTAGGASARDFFEGHITAHTSSNVFYGASTDVTVNGPTTVTIIVPSAVPQAPTNVSLTTPSPTNQNPAFSWTGVSGATYYNIYRNGTLIDTVGANNMSYTDTSLTADGSYTYTISAVSGGGESAQSSPVTVVYDTTPPAVTISGAINGEAYTANNAPTPVCDTTDSLSGVATNATLTVLASGNSYTATCSGATDNAGNSGSSVSSTYTVLPANYTLVNLTDSNGNTLSGAKVTLENSHSTITTLSTDNFGNAFANTAAGTYKATVYYANGYESQTIVVTANGPNTVDFSTVPVMVTITDPNTTDLSNATVAQAGNTGTFGSKQSVNSGGQITLQTLPGTNYFTAYVANGYEEQSLVVSPTNNTVAFSTDSVTVSVTKNGGPLTTATVAHAGNSGSYSSKQAVDGNGQYVFYVLPGTNYFEAFDGTNYAKETLGITGDTSTTLAVQ